MLANYAATHKSTQFPFCSIPTAMSTADMRRLEQTDPDTGVRRLLIPIRCSEHSTHRALMLSTVLIISHAGPFKTQYIARGFLEIAEDPLAHSRGTETFHCAFISGVMTARIGYWLLYRRRARRSVAHRPTTARCDAFASS